jgi:hypothetical protein
LLAKVAKWSARGNQFVRPDLPRAGSAESFANKEENP